VLADRYREGRSALRAIAWAMGLVTLSVLLLSAAGIYALMSFTVSQRTREIGIRTALGAAPGRVLVTIFRRTAWQVGGGVLVGTALSGGAFVATGLSLSGAAPLLVAVATISGVGLNPFPPERGDVAVIALPLLVPLLVLAIPLLDVLLAIVRRTRKGLGIAHADKEHIFHRLMDIGHGHRQTVLLMYLWSALVCGSALAIGVIDGLLVAGAIVAGAVILFLVTALPRFLERRRNGDANGQDKKARAVDPAGTSGAAMSTPSPTTKHPSDAAPVDPSAP